MESSKAQVNELVIVCLSLGPFAIQDGERQFNSTYSFLDISGAEAKQLYLESE